MNEDIYDILLTQYGLSPAQIDEILALSTLAGEEGILEEQMEQAEGYQNQPLPQGRFAGRTYNAAHPLEFAATGLKEAAGLYGAHKTRQEQRDLLQEQMQRRAQLLRSMTSKQPTFVSPQTTPSGNPSFFSTARSMGYR